MSQPFPPGEPPRPRPLPAPTPAPPRAAGRPAFVPREPVRGRSKQSNPGATVAIVLGIVFIVLLLTCGVGGTMFVFAFQRASAQASRARAELERQQRQQDRRFTEQLRQQRTSRPSLPPPGRRVIPTREDLEAQLPPYERHLAWLKGHDDHQVREAAEWFAKQPVTANHQGEVQAALLAKARFATTENLPALMAALSVWAEVGAVPDLVSLSKRKRDEAAPVVAVIEKFEDEETTDALVQLLRERSAVAEYAAAALVRRPDAAKPKLLPLVNDPDERLRTAVQTILREMEVTDGDLLEQALTDMKSTDQRQRAIAFAWIGSATLKDEDRARVLAVLGAAMLGEDRSLRNQALQALVADKSQQSSNLLLTTLEGPKEPWSGALEELLERGDERVAAHFESLVKEPQTMGRTLHAVRKTKGGEPVVRKFLLTCQDRDVLRHILFAFGDSANEASLPALEQVRKLAEKENDAGLKIAVDHVMQRMQTRTP